MASNVIAVNDVNQDMLINSDGLQVSVQNSINSPNKIRNKTSIETKPISSTLSKKANDQSKKRTKNHCRRLPFDECDGSLKNCDILQEERKVNREEKEARSSIESVIKSQCDLPIALTEADPSNSRLSYISHRSSNPSSGRASRISCRSTSSASLPSSYSQIQPFHKKEQRRRISIQNEDVPHIRNKDALSRQEKRAPKQVVTQTAPLIHQLNLHVSSDDTLELEDNVKSDRTNIRRLSSLSSQKPSTSSTSANAARKVGKVSVEGSSRNGGSRIEKKGKRKLKGNTIKNTTPPDSVNSLSIYGCNETKYLKQIRPKQSQTKATVNSISPGEEDEEKEYEDINSDTDPEFAYSSAKFKEKPVKTTNTKGRTENKSKIKPQTKSVKTKVANKRTLNLPLATKAKKLFTPRKPYKPFKDIKTPKTPFITPIAARIRSKIRRKRKEKDGNGKKSLDVVNSSTLSLTPATSSVLNSHTFEQTNNVHILIHPTEEKSNGRKSHSKKTTFASEVLQKGVSKRKLFKSVDTTQNITAANPPIQPMPSKSSPITMKTTATAAKKNKRVTPASPSLAVAAVFASKIAKSTKKAEKKEQLKGIKHTKKSIFKKNTRVKVNPTPNSSADRDVVTKYLKKFKEHISPKKQNSLRLIQNVPVSSNKPPMISGKGKGAGKKSIKVLQNSENDDIEYFNEVEDKPENLARMKKAKAKKGSKIFFEDDEVIFKKPTKPVSPYKKKILRTSKVANTTENVATVKTSIGVKSTFKRIKSGVSKLKKTKASERKVLRSSHR